MTATIIRGDARRLPLPDGSVDLIVTSPPYFGLRSYQDGGEHYGGQIGAEPTPAAYVAALLECTREWMRVLKPEGSLWINLGDKYAGAPSGPRTNPPRRMGKGNAASWATRRRHDLDVPNKSLMGLPWRYALGCIDDLGLILRAEVIWAKPNGLPESVTDRVRRSHEQWFHLVKSPQYFSAVDEIREDHAPAGLARRKYAFAVNAAQRASRNPVLNGEGERPANPLGKLPGSVREIATQPLTVPAELEVDHFAAFPMEWPRRIISGWSPAGICTTCGEGRRPVADKVKVGGWIRGTEATRRREGSSSGSGGQKAGNRVHDHIEARITGYACSCPDTTAPSRPAVVLDPFGGTGTTALLATTLGRRGISVDRSADYCRLAAWRTTDPGERARALGVPKPAPVIDGQGDLFGGLSA